MRKPHWAYYLPNPGMEILNKADNIRWKRERIAYMQTVIADMEREADKMEAEFLDYVSTGEDCWTQKEISEAKIAFVNDKSDHILQIEEL